jgi:hypothetical protein
MFVCFVHPLSSKLLEQSPRKNKKALTLHLRGHRHRHQIFCGRFLLAIITELSGSFSFFFLFSSPPRL